MPVPITPARASLRRSTPSKSPRASRPRCTRRPRLPGMREAINGTQRQSVALGGMGIYGYQKLSAAISGHQRKCSGPSFAGWQKSRRPSGGSSCLRPSIGTTSTAELAAAALVAAEAPLEPSSQGVGDPRGRVTHKRLLGSSQDEHPAAVHCMGTRSGCAMGWQDKVSGMRSRAAACGPPARRPGGWEDPSCWPGAGSRQPRAAWAAHGPAWAEQRRP